ncbi:hypothetical protein BP6252_06555 [Coleophoma cylindrospora]|uniref:CorA-like transporter domain-containing protein n=1 Tax=Coleophoma cylindrospora TaxID=1849047 RepID=A0A3D8RMZ2_9HELO|nr:hypothetical protein BP6252_06555 [Coleophoma cylindrospora]
MALQRFVASCDASENFPQNHLSRTNHCFQHTLTDHFVRLNQQSGRLFHPESKAELDLLEYVDSTDGVIPISRSLLKVLAQLQMHLRGPAGSVKLDPQARFMFVHAKHSRDPLRVTREMLMFAFTYHQVAPAFLDYLFLFGKQHYPQGFHYSGFRSESTLSSKKAIFQIPELDRSGQGYSLCYNLKSVEQSHPDPNKYPDPWSIRQIAVYHSFDVVTCKALWVSIKGNSLIRDRIIEPTKTSNGASADIISSKADAFIQSLHTHLLLIDWCGEKWRWYINFLEELSESKTRRALLTSADTPAARFYPVQPRPNTPSQIGIFDRASQRVRSFGKVQPLVNQNVAAAMSEERIAEEEGFNFENLQEVQNYEEKANQVILVLESNINIVMQIKAFYVMIVELPEFPPNLKDECKTEMAEFIRTIDSVVNDLKMQMARAKMLRAQIADRKSLFNGILNYQNMEASKSFAEEARLSTNRMEGMTKEMQILAQKTKQETVSMRVITLVTLFFLPGTFISTIMSTDIIKYQADSNGTMVENYSPRALLLYLEITLPLMAVTFIAWFLVYKWVNRAQDKTIQKTLYDLKLVKKVLFESPV